jgi:hypothetical protein
MRREAETSMVRLLGSLKPAGIAATPLPMPSAALPLAALAESARPDVASLPVSVDATPEQVIRGDRIKGVCAEIVLKQGDLHSIRIETDRNRDRHAACRGRGLVG